MRVHLKDVLGVVLWITLIVAVDCACPCINPDWCMPITAADRKEVFMFTVSNNVTSWGRYDWTRTTTVGKAGKADPDLMCLAHQHNARVVLLVDYPGADLTNATKRTAWVQQQLKTVQDSYYDGVNIDFEEAISENDTARIQGLTDLVKEAYTAFKQAMPYSQVTMDVPYGPTCIYNRCFDFKSLASFVDFFFIMDYDEWGGTVAGPNSGFERTLEGIMKYLAIVPSSKLLMGVPWYGYKYKCSALSMDHQCTIEGRGSQLPFTDIYNTLYQTHSQRLWNDSYMSPFFSYRDTAAEATYQIWYDDPESLIYKYNMAAKYGLRGVGVWQADCVNYTDTPLDNAVRNWMWDALPLVN